MIFKTNAIIALMPDANKYTYQRMLRFMDGSADNLTKKEKTELRRIIQYETQKLLNRL